MPTYVGEVAGHNDHGADDDDQKVGWGGGGSLL